MNESSIFVKMYDFTKWLGVIYITLQNYLSLRKEFISTQWQVYQYILKPYSPSVNQRFVRYFEGFLSKSVLHLWLQK